MQLTALLALLFLTQSSAADWAAITKQSLINADLIVYGQYIGQSTLKIQHQGLPVNLGVLQVAKTFKGSYNAPIVFIKRYNLKGPFRSDMLHFNIGQSGLWFLNLVPNTEGIYQITHPSQFKELGQDSLELKHWQQQFI